MKKALLLSGGFDSAVVFHQLIESETNFDVFFVDYNQSYKNKEQEKARKLCSKYKTINLFTIKISGWDDMPGRNFHFINQIQIRGYDEIYLGTRWILPLFDTWGDANWFTLKIYGHLLKIKVKLPIVGWTKRNCFQFLSTRNSTDFYNCYKNNDNWRDCNCSNCQERQKLKNFI